VKEFIRANRHWVVLLFKVSLVGSALFVAFLLRFDFRIPEPHLRAYLLLLPLALVAKLAVFWRQGLFHGWWRYASLADVLTLARANLYASLAFIVLLVILQKIHLAPRSVLILDWILCFSFLAGTRLFTRALRENYLPFLGKKGKGGLRTLIIGAGSAGQMIAKEIRQNSHLGKTIVGFVDDDPDKLRRTFVGFEVLGSQDELTAICRQHRVEEIIVAIPSATGKEMRAIVERCQSLGVAFKTLPGISDLIDGKVSIQQVREVDLEDLLGREAVRLELERIRAFLEGKRVFVSGAAGSIGSEICRQVCRFHPARIILFDHAESPLFSIHNEIAREHPELRHTAIVGDVRDRARIHGLFDECEPQVVFHAAAYKHVPLMEHNPAEAANNNVRGSRVMADAADAFHCEAFVMISTDKAVNPTNVMGATKRAAELYVQALARTSRTRFVTVRFGNVLGSAGSVVPTFKKQIAQGGPVTVTHREVTRFFMTIPEATQLVLQAGSMGQGGEIYLLDMGEPVKILDLAEELIRLSGFTPYEDIEIRFSGLRPGEKLFEELLIAGEGVKPTSHEKIMVAESTPVDRAHLEQQLEELYQCQRALDQAAVVAKLREIVPEYCPEKAGAQKQC